MGRPRQLITGELDLTNWSGYALAPDGERFLMVRSNPEAIPNRIHLILNWSRELERLVP